MIKYPYSRPDVSDADIQAVVSSLKGQFLTQGPALEAFETALCECLGGQQAVVCNSGTAALHLIYMALGLGPQAGLVTSPLTFVATANAARMCGAPVSFSDTDPTTGLMTPDDLQRAIESADFLVRAASIIHLGGRVADLPALQAVAEAHNILLVEDACHAPGAAYDSTAGRHRIGDCSHSIAAAFSFHAIKHVTMGEGSVSAPGNVQDKASP
jgi:dTDP-4-amino-4,6-dideoxygalactose transaminase